MEEGGSAKLAVEWKRKVGRPAAGARRRDAGGGLLGDGTEIDGRLAREAIVEERGGTTIATTGKSEVRRPAAGAWLRVAGGGWVDSVLLLDVRRGGERRPGC